jgi:hypothetical protein
MQTRTAAIVIDNFLSESQWQYIQNNLGAYLNAPSFVEDRNDPYNNTIEFVARALGFDGSEFFFYQYIASRSQ